MSYYPAPNNNNNSSNVFNEKDWISNNEIDNENNGNIDLSEYVSKTKQETLVYPLHLNQLHFQDGSIQSTAFESNLKTDISNNKYKLSEISYDGVKTEIQNLNTNSLTFGTNTTTQTQPFTNSDKTQIYTNQGNIINNTNNINAINEFFDGNGNIKLVGNSSYVRFTSSSGNTTHRIGRLNNHLNLENNIADKNISLTTTGTGKILLNSIDVLSQINTNINNITSNLTQINTNSNNVASNLIQINTNKNNITTNSNNIASNLSQINTNSNNINQNLNKINQNTTAISNIITKPQIYIINLNQSQITNLPTPIPKETSHWSDKRTNLGLLLNGLGCPYFNPITGEYQFAGASPTMEINYSINFDIKYGRIIQYKYELRNLLISNTDIEHNTTTNLVKYKYAGNMGTSDAEITLVSPTYIIHLPSDLETNVYGLFLDALNQFNSSNYTPSLSMTMNVKFYN